MDGRVELGYAGVGLLLSVFYGLRAAWLTRHAHPVERLHQIWFNFAGSAFGWLVGYWVLRRFVALLVPGTHTPPLGFMEVLLALLAALGVVGYLPQTLNAIPGLLGYLSRLAAGKFEQSAQADAATQRL